jgi:hypothetical protein
MLAADVSQAAHPEVSFHGGTPWQRTEVKRALAASSFPWSVLPPIEVRIAAGAATQALPGVVILDANLVDMGSFSWGVIQHEFAHQLDFLMLDDAGRKSLQRILGGQAWCWHEVGYEVAHGYLGCERFASTVAWTFWQSAENALQPGDETVVPVDVARFTRALSTALGVSVTPPSRLAMSSSRERRQARLARPSALGPRARPAR